MERTRSTRSGLFAIELLITIGVFSLCAAISIGLFVQAEIMSRDSSDLNFAINAARSVSEVFKASEGDLEETLRVLNAHDIAQGEGDADALFLYYDGAWQPCEESDSVFHIGLLKTSVGGVSAAEVSVYGRDGERLTGWTVAALGPIEEGSAKGWNN